MIKKILLLDKNHLFISYKLRKKGFIYDEKNINFLEIIIRNLTISKKFIEKAINFIFIARIG
ncbi:hypothetical protein [Blattabacterium cuenoti]|uniref:hypothetical protein n=1 Tax=Blattabacterium cuenoti TaxID=1653831 RepID=UPI00163CCED0|nr:hypothetical protein [Blattabacterium cuenoti]